MELRSVTSGFIPERSREAAADVDIIVVGGGISGTLAASVLGRSGYTVCLIDRHAIFQPEFRAEHLDGPQIGQLHRLGFLGDLTLGLYRGESVTVARSGRVVSSAGTINYGLRYDDLVNRARALLPRTVQTVVGRVVQVEASDTIQRVRLSDGGIVSGRLVVLATGQGQAVGKSLGINRRLIRHGHSLTFGFDIEPVGRGAFEHSFLVYQREQPRDRIDYLAAFTMGDTTRVNLFTYRDYKEPWTRAFVADPAAGLGATLPGLATVIGDYRPVGPVVARPIDLYASEGYRRDGVVMIGDAFQAACPATGMGMVRLLTDIEQLTTLHIPRWLRTAGMAAAKIGTFYDDPVKRACDHKALHDSEYRRAVSTEMTLAWRLHRVRVHSVERLSGWRGPRRHAAYPRSSPERSQGLVGDPVPWSGLGRPTTS